MLHSSLHLILLLFFAWFTLTSAKVKFFSLDDVDKEGPDGFNSDTSGVTQNSGFHAAVLVAGTAGYGDYRHQADICHAYQMLRRKGMPSDNIIVFIYNDIAYNGRNPYPGKIYNVPGGYDVYPGCAKDYTGSNVNKIVLNAVMRGDAAAVRGKGSGRVLKKIWNQRVFLAYSGRGSTGLIVFPSGSPLYADEFNGLLMQLRKDSMFYEVLVYIESSSSGSMFDGMSIEKEERMLGVSASGPREGSYATYCPSSSMSYSQTVNPNEIGSCMADLFSVSWILDAETRNVFQTTVYQHLLRVTDATSVSGTYYRGSHVTRYGDTRHFIHDQKLGNFLSGGSAVKTNPMDSIRGRSSLYTKGENYKQIDADLAYLYLEASKNDNPEASVQLDKELAMRRLTDEVIYSSLTSLIGSGHLPADTPVSKFAEEAIPRGQGKPVVSDWDCLRSMVDAWEDKCGRLNSYSSQYSRTFVNLCNALITPAAFKESISCEELVYV